MPEAKKLFKIAMSERCYRFKPDALVSHAPDRPGVYEFVIFDPSLTPIVLFIGLAESSVRQSLAAHLMGNLAPTGETLFKISKDVYFDYVASVDEGGGDAPSLNVEDCRDIAASLIRKHRPRLNAAQLSGSGRYAEVVVEEIG